MLEMAQDLTQLTAEALEARVAEVRERIAPLDRQLRELRAERDVLLTEQRRRERLARSRERADLRARMKAGDLPTIAEVIANVERGEFDEYAYSMKTGGEVRLGFPGARRQSLTFTDGRQVVQAKDFQQAAELYAAGWSLGAADRPGIRVYFPGTRLERLVDQSEVFARPAD